MYPSTTIPVQDFLDSIPAQHRKNPHDLLQILIQIQHAYHYVPKEAAKQLADEMEVPLVRVQGLLSFYSFLSAEPQGDYVIHFSDNITDQMLGNRELAAHLCERLGVKLGETRKDGRVSVHFTSCTGMCDQGPAALVNYLPVTRLDAERIDRIVDLVNAQIPLKDWPLEFFKVESQIRRSDVVFRKPTVSGEGIRASLERSISKLAATRKEVSGMLRDAGLRK